MDESPDNAAQGNLTPASQEPSNAVRGWQALAETRGQELAEARSRLAAYEQTEAARQLAAEYPDAAEFALREGRQLSRSIEGELAAMQRAITAYEPRIDANNPRKQAPQQPRPQTVNDLEQEAGDMLARHLADRF